MKGVVFAGGEVDHATHHRWTIIDLAPPCPVGPLLLPSRGIEGVQVAARAADIDHATRPPRRGEDTPLCLVGPPLLLASASGRRGLCPLPFRLPLPPP